MKLLSLTLALLNSGCAFAQTSKKWSVSLKVADEENQPVAGADVKILYTLPAKPGQTTFDQLGHGKIEKLTGIDGLFGVESSQGIGPSMGLGIQVQKEKFYPSYLHHRLYRSDQFDEQTVTANNNWGTIIVLKKIGKPIPMYAKQIVSLRVPELNRAIGYDLMIGDWVGTYGKGISADLFLTEMHTNSEYILSISFPKSGDGIQEFTVPETEKGSGFRSAHEAPDSGYQQEIAQTKATNPNRNFYFRVRTKIDDRGNIVSTHYGKIYGDLAQFTYYFNPTINDRNVEFNPKLNLIKNLKLFEEVKQP